MLLITFRVWANTSLLWLLQRGVYPIKLWISGRIISNIPVSLSKFRPSQGLLEISILHNSSLILSTLIFFKKSKVLSKLDFFTTKKKLSPPALAINSQSFSIKTSKSSQS